MLFDRVRDQTNTVGTGSYVLTGTTDTGDRTIVSAVPANTEITIGITDDAGTWEVVTGVFDGVNTITRANFEDSSTGAAINWPNAAAKTVIIGASARSLAYALAGLMGTTAGTANAQTLTPAPAIQAYRARARYSMIAGLTNTAALTLNISGKGARAVKKMAAGAGGLVDLEPGDWAAGAIPVTIDDGTQLILLNPTPRLASGFGAGILTRTGATALKFGRKNGLLVPVNGALREIPSAGITAANTGVYVNGVAGQNLAANTACLATLFNNAGTPTFDFKTTLTHAPGLLGAEVWNSDDTRTVIGLLQTNASAQFDDSDALRNVASWFNRQNKRLLGANINAGTASGASVEISSGGRVQACVWADDAIEIAFMGFASSSAVATWFASLNRDGSALLLPQGMSITPSGAGATQNDNLGPYYDAAAEGNHYWTLVGNVTGGTATYTGNVAGMVRS